MLLTCLLTGLLVTFILTAPLFGYLGDRYNRKYIIIGGSVIWIVSSFSSSFVSQSVRGMSVSNLKCAVFHPVVIISNACVRSRLKPTGLTKSTIKDAKPNIVLVNIFTMVKL